MITRIVKLPIVPNSEDGIAFEALFDHYKKQIAGAEGCMNVKLLASSNCYFTYSIWEAEKYLEAYRHSAVFAEVWPQTKALFTGKASAWTCDELHSETA
jgi:heme-degrading monooxygenase HmoA